MKLKQLVIRADKVRLKELINEVLDDIAHFGKNVNVILFYVNNAIEDYEVYIEGEEYPIYSDETYDITSIMNWLFTLISAAEGTKFGALIKAHRLANNLTQQKLADAVGVNIRLVQRWEADEFKPRSNNLFKLIRELDLDPKIVGMFIK